jgi:hypothetical protein
MKSETGVKMIAVKTLLLFVFLFVFGQHGFSFPAHAGNELIPVSGGASQPAGLEKTTFVSLEDFKRGVSGGNAGDIRGLYVQDVLALRVVKQPDGKPEYVSSVEGIVTQFGMAAGKGVTGLLAHNYASGRHFFNLTEGQVVNVSYGDGSEKAYIINRIMRFQALQPDSPTSDFINLETNERLSAERLFTQVYTGSHRVTLQTCIQQGAEDAWGRLFVIAEPI